MKKAIMYGAGNIGRGFIGQLLSESGYEVVFIDVNTDIVDHLNADKCYPIRFLSNDSSYDILVKNVRAVNGLDVRQVAYEISTADFMATAVGVNILPRIAGPIARGLEERWKCGNMNPINILICENMLEANHYLKGLIETELESSDVDKLEGLVGFVKASIGRMVPVMTPEMSEGNILRINVEAYKSLPVDKEGFKGEIPVIVNMKPYSPFEYYSHRKLFIHNMGHAIAAYLGFLKGYTFIWEAIGDAYIREICRNAMLESAKAIALEHDVESTALIDYIDELILRFGNLQLGDTVERVGKDVQRKLAMNDRLIGALNLCSKNGIEPIYIRSGIAAALLFKDTLINNVTRHLENEEIDIVLDEVCGIKMDSIESKTIINAYQVLHLVAR
jgi:mannitol-1-phosphate 5-dehydrogenase